MKRAIHRDRLPIRLPIGATAIIWLILDRLRPSGVAVGIAWSFVAMWWFVSIVAFCLQKEFDPWSGQP